MESTEQSTSKQTKKPIPAKPAREIPEQRLEFVDKHVIVKTNGCGIYFGIFKGYRSEPFNAAKHPDDYKGPKLSHHIIRLEKARRIWELGKLGDPGYQSLADLAEVGPNKKLTRAQIMGEQEEVELEHKNFGKASLYTVMECDPKAVKAFYAAPAYEHE